MRRRLAYVGYGPSRSGPEDPHVTRSGVFTDEVNRVGGLVKAIRLPLIGAALSAHCLTVGSTSALPEVDCQTSSPHAASFQHIRLNLPLLVRMFVVTCACHSHARLNRAGFGFAPSLFTMPRFARRELVDTA